MVSCFKDLSVDQQKVLQFRYRGAKHRDIASEMACAKKTVENLEKQAWETIDPHSILDNRAKNILLRYWIEENVDILTTSMLNPIEFLKKKNVGHKTIHILTTFFSTYDGNYIQYILGDVQRSLRKIEFLMRMIPRKANGGKTILTTLERLQKSATETLA